MASNLSPLPGVVQAADVRHFLNRVLGVYGEDWFVERWPDEYEGWSGALKQGCGECVCCDPVNLNVVDLFLVRELYGKGQPPASDEKDA